MGIVNYLASFPNTRQRPRKPTRVADVYGGIAPINVPVLAKEANKGRTYLTIRNINNQDTLVYGYGPQANDMQFLMDNGMHLRAGDSMDIEAYEQDIYVMSIGLTPVQYRLDEGRG